jgi:hypothetical protein
MDFGPLAETNSRGLGRVVKEPYTIDISDLTDSSQETRSFITSLPYVEVVSDRVLKVDGLEDIWIDKDRIYLLLSNYDSLELSSKLEVIDI